MPVRNYDGRVARTRRRRRLVYFGALQHGDEVKPTGEKFLAWVEPREGDGGFMASFVAANTLSHRAPATHGFSSPVEAKEWVEREASELGVTVEWVDRSWAGH